MIKRISLHQLKPGMYIHDLNCSWVVHPLFLTRFKVKSDREIEKIAALGVREVYIDSALGDDLHDALTLDEVKRDIDEKLQQLAGAARPMPESRISRDEEIETAVGVHQQAHRVIRNMMSDVRLGRQLAAGGVEETIAGIADSVLRNSSALIQLSQIKNKDDYTFLHSVGVCALMTSFCNALHLGKDVTRQVSIGALLHDIGKMQVANEILNKPGRLTESEFDEMKQHVAYGSNLIAGVKWVTPISRAVLEQHHERYDGTGYPAGLKGEAISQFGQMAAIVDVYDAITAERVYHQAMAPVDALRKLQEWSKFHFNEELVRHFIRSVGIYPVGTLVKLESGLLGIVLEQNSADLLSPVLRIVYDSYKRYALTPYNLNLAEDAGRADRIVSYELPENWGVDVQAYLKA
ncbi:MAG: HD-GYP domain-containing protein [Sulfuricellaceae bacterium]